MCPLAHVINLLSKLQQRVAALTFFVCLSTSLLLSRLAQVYTASSQIIKRIILRHLEHPVSTIIQLSLFRIVNPGLFSIKSTLSTETAGTSTSCPS